MTQNGLCPNSNLVGSFSDRGLLDACVARMTEMGYGVSFLWVF